MSDKQFPCPRCGDPQIDGGIDYFCPKSSCVPTRPEQALRFNTGKTSYKEIYPKFIEAIAEVMSKSRAKYPEFNWTKSTNFSTPLDSLHRHLAAFENGEDFDKESQSQHLAHIATNVMFLMYQFNNHPEMDDRFFKDKK